MPPYQLTHRTIHHVEINLINDPILLTKLVPERALRSRNALDKIIGESQAY